MKKIKQLRDYKIFRDKKLTSREIDNAIAYDEQKILKKDKKRKTSN